MPTPEGLILAKCKDMLKKLETLGWVRHYVRLNVGLHRNMQGYLQQQGTPGESDLVAFVPVLETMHVFFFEVKSAVGKQSATQKQFEDKLKGFSNVHYHLITDDKQIKYLIQHIKGIAPRSSKYNEKVLESFQ